MFGAMNQKQIEKMMKQMGIQNEKIEADEVIIKKGSKQLVITNPEIMKIKMGGNETYQITGHAEEKGKEGFSDEDVRMVMDQTGASEDDARDALEREGDIAAAIMKIKS
ncbi:MAG: nascent polypeptide-associated complex protein [Candidatus Aenigmarchaeota archaeon]|nr:nascent polypeptide-associated complex protein [Candidatus Aenigmarchaeota archaeon]